MSRRSGSDVGWDGGVKAWSALSASQGPQHDGLPHAAAGPLVGAGELDDVLGFLGGHRQDVQARSQSQVHLGQLAEGLLFGFVEGICVDHVRE